MPTQPRENPFRARATTAVACLLVAAVTSCSVPGSGGTPAGTEGSRGPAAGSASPAPGGAVAAAVAGPTAVLDAVQPADLAAALSEHLLQRSGSVVVTADDPRSVLGAATVAAQDGVPLLLPGPAAAAEVRRLGAGTVLTVGQAARTWAEQEFTGPGAPDVEDAEAPGRAPDTSDGPARDVVVLTTGAPPDRPAAASAEALGARVVVVPGGDPRAHPAAVEALHAAGAGHVVALGPAFGPPEVLQHRVAVARTGVQVPGGGQLPLADRRLVALYGHPGAPSLGVLGEQSMEATLDRARENAARYEGLDGLPPVPALEVITTIASGEPGADGDHSLETDPAELEPWVDAAEAAGIAVLLDLQPGRADFLTQAQRYESLLRRPHVGLALDPEWRLAPGQVHLEQIGSVSAEEVNRVGDWLADLVRRHDLPQKVLLLHQFRTSMVRDRPLVDTGRDELVVLVHADGHGTPELKRATYENLTAGASPDLRWGWKNFLDEDRPTFTPEQTVAVDPSPVFVSYQ
ncbi:hypothetical protein [Kineococcus sp. SYSU DK004]|uniref:hypothetical protein n=1 Tax=Kineococcus sp. SYSU DK004 TaxID=3383125 RepID=UPI003D7EE91C